MQWNDAYEEYFPLQTTYKVAPLRSQYDKNAEGYACRWGYPALIEPANDVFALISEANIEQHQSASCLFNDGELYHVSPATNDLKISGNWHTPWRTIIIGSLADIVASTLITDVSEPCQLADTKWIQPGVVSWIYWANNHGSNDYDIICKYVDMAATLQLPYVLIDAEWDMMKNGKTVEDAVSYAKAKGIKPMIWYNSSVGWIDGAPTPKFRLNKPEDREKEFAWCEKIGVVGGLLHRPAQKCCMPSLARQLPRRHRASWLAAHISEPVVNGRCVGGRMVQQQPQTHEIGSLS